MGKITVSEEVGTPQTPSTGLRSLFPKTDGWYEIDDQGIERKVFTDNNFGSLFSEVSNDQEMTNANKNAYVVHSLMTSEPFEIGQKIRVGITSTWNIGDKKKNINIDLKINGSSAKLIKHRTIDTAAATWNTTTTFFYYDITSNGTIDLSLEFKPDGNTATMSFSGIECWRV